MLTGCTYDGMFTVSSASASVPSSAVSAEPVGGTLEVHYIDAGQADAILIKLPDGGIMQIDAGKNKTAEEITDYIRGEGVTKIDYLVGTHPHEDHIGGLDNVIRAFDIENIYMPRLSSSETPTTQTYKDVLTAISEKGCRIHASVAGDVIIDEPNLRAEVLSPSGGDYDGVNEYSIVVKLTYGGTSFLFMGDAEAVNEQEILSRGSDVNCDVLKLGHHGSSTSSTEAFLKAASPEYAVISCGRDNSYGHPHSEVVERCDALGIKMLRTDQSGTVIITSDGSSVSVAA